MTAAAPRQQRNWDWRAAGNFIGGGTGTGLLFAAAFDSVLGGALRDAILLGLMFVAGGLFLVWLEIGKPWRFLNVYRQPQRSWMTREAYAAFPVFGCGLAGWWFGLPVLIVATAVFGVLFLYCQGRILTASKGIPTWREPALLPLVVVTGLTEGVGLFAVLLAIFEPAAVWPAALLLALLIGRGYAWLRYRKRVDGAAPTTAIEVLDRLGKPLLLAGHLAPIAVIVLVAPAAGFGPVLIAGAGIIALISGWVLKFVIVTRAAYTQGFAVANFPARGAGGAPARSARPGWN